MPNSKSLWLVGAPPQAIPSYLGSFLHRLCRGVSTLLLTLTLFFFLLGFLVLSTGPAIYHKTPKNADTPKNCCNYLKIGTVSFYYRVMCPKDADRTANSEDPDLTVPLGAVWSGSAVFAKTRLSEKLRIIMVSSISSSANLIKTSFTE